MNILVDIGHPAHVHLMRNTISDLRRDGHNVIVTTKDVPIIRQLLEHYNIDYISLGQKGDGLSGKLFKQIIFNYKLWRIAVSRHIDIATGTSMTIPIVSKFCRMKSINMDDDDDEVQMQSVRFSHPFSDIRLTPAALKGHRRSPHAVFYNGTHELAYLHPNRFKPDPEVLHHAGLQAGERFFILRLVAFSAYHDGGEHGLSNNQLHNLIDILKPHGRIIITSEKKLHEDFEQYRLPVPPWEIHSLMAYCSLFVGDSQTMTSEAAVLGIPAFKCNTFAGRLSVPNMFEQKYGLCYSYHPTDFALMTQHIERLLGTDPGQLSEEWQHKRATMLGDMIDVASFFTEYIENFPIRK